MKIIDRPFLQGPRQDVDRAFTPEGAVFRVRDGRMRSGGAWGKRHGYTAIDQSVTDFSETIESEPSAIGEFAGRSVLVSDGRVFTRDDGAFQESGRASRFLPRAIHWVHFNDTGGNAYAWSLAAAGGVLFVAFTFVDGAGTYQTDVQGIDQSGNRVFAQRLSGTWQPRLLAIGSTLFVFVAVRSSGVIRGYALDASAPLAAGGLGSPTTVGTLAATTLYAFDVCTFGSNILLAHATASGTLRVRSLSQAFATLDTEDVTIAAGTTKPTIYYNAAINIIHVGVLVSGNSYSATLSGTTLAVIAGPTQYGSGVTSEPWFTDRGNSSTWMIFREANSSPLRYATRVAVVDGSNSIVEDHRVHHMQPACRPFNGNAGLGSGAVDMWLHTDNNIGDEDDLTQSAWGFQRRYGLYSLSMHLGSVDRIVLHPELVPDERAHFEIGQTIGATNEGPWLSEVATIGARHYMAALTPIRTTSADGVRIDEACALVIYEWEDNNRHAVLPAAGAGVVLGGHLQEVLSHRLEYSPNIGFAPTKRGTENGFMRAPAILAVSQSGTGTLTAGVYQICSVFEYVDADGRRHRSAPSNVVTATVTGTSDDAIAITVASYSAFEREIASTAHATALHVYATQADGEIFHRVSSDNVVTAAYSSNYNLSFTLSADPDPAAEILYTDGGVWPIQPAPSHRFGCLAGDRLVLGGLFDARIIEVSRFMRPQQPAEFTRASPFRAVLPEDCTALGHLDGQIVAFSERGIYLIDAGALPNDQGFPGLPTPIPLPTDVGALEGTPVIQIPAGLVFQSRRGIYLLPRGFGPPRYLSGPVKEDLGSRKVLGAALIHYAADGAGRELSSHCLYFGVGDEETDLVDWILVLDVDSLQWIARDKPHGGATPRPRVLGAWNGRCVLARSEAFGGDETLVQEDPESFLDEWATLADPSPLLEITTGEIRPFGFAGRGKVHKVRVFGEFASDCTVRLSTSPDGRYSAEYEQPSVLLGDIETIGDRVQADFTPRPSGCEVNSVSYTVQVWLARDENGDDVLADEEGALIHGLALAVEPMPGDMKGIPVSKRV